MSFRIKLIVSAVVALLIVYGFFALDIPYRRDIESIPAAASSTLAYSTSTPEDMIYVESPDRDASVSWPVKISGFARGPWFFEATFPIQVLGADGTTIVATGFGRARGPWMTDDFVPWSAEISLPVGSPIPARGIIRLERDNPSGDPSRDMHVDVPVRFITSSQ